MPQFSNRSLMHLGTCDPRLQRLCFEAIKVIDFRITCGHRPEAEQEEAFQAGRSKLQYPNSKHNPLPSRAFDFCPFPIDYADINRFYRVIGVLEATAHRLGIPVKFGADFKTFRDLPHVELLD